MEVKDSWIQSIDYFSFCNYNTLLTFLPDLHQEADFPDWARDIELTTCTCKLLIKYNKNEYHK